MNLIKLDDYDVVWAKTRLPKKVVDRVIKFAKDRKEIVIAGGFLRSMVAKEPVNDIDIFAQNAKVAKHFAQGFDVKMHETQNAYSFTIDDAKVQVIKKWVFDSVFNVLRHFDFTIAQAALYYDRVAEEWTGNVSDRFYTDLAARRLIYTDPLDPEPASSMLRMLKFTKLGYYAPTETIGKIVEAMQKKEKTAVQQLLDAEAKPVSSEEK